MEKKNIIKRTSAFKLQATKAILSVIFFGIIYLLILLSAIGLTILCIVGGSALIALKPMLLTFLFGLGLSGLGLIVLIFLLQFATRPTKVDRSNLLQIQRADEPHLFCLIDEIARRVGTSTPKNVYLSADVNAAVFYDSNFWSMFLPVKKNLQIGLGLVNTVTQLELTSILAHEFGHFSQRTMKVGSYVYQVNQIIFNLLNNNTFFRNVVQQWTTVRYFSFFVIIAIRITRGIQWVLSKLYPIVNKNFLRLSREMEFQADEIAAHVTGPEPLKAALLRLPLAEHALNYVFSFYEGKIADRLKSENLYRDQGDVMIHLARINGFPIKNEYPYIAEGEQSRFGMCKLVIKDQWTSHPGMNERITRLDALHIPVAQKADEPANRIFSDIDTLQKALTASLFDSIDYEGQVKILPFEAFQAAYKQDLPQNYFSVIYNGYYDDKDPIYFETEMTDDSSKEEAADTGVLFSDKKVAMVYSAMALQSDLEVLKNISTRAIDVKTFDYDGIKYSQEESKDLVLTLEAELEGVHEAILKNDRKIFSFFSRLAHEQNNSAGLACVRQNFFESDQTIIPSIKFCHDLSDRLQFVHENHSFEQIRINLHQIKPLEEKLKTDINKLLTAGSKYGSVMTPDIRNSLEIYTSSHWEYFDGARYLEENLKIFYTAMDHYVHVLTRGRFFFKQELLRYQEALIAGEAGQPA